MSGNPLTSFSRITATSVSAAHWQLTLASRMVGLRGPPAFIHKVVAYLVELLADAALLLVVFVNFLLFFSFLFGFGFFDLALQLEAVFVFLCFLRVKFAFSYFLKQIGGPHVRLLLPCGTVGSVSLFSFHVDSVWRVVSYLDSAVRVLLLTEGDMLRNNVALVVSDGSPSSHFSPKAYVLHVIALLFLVLFSCKAFSRCSSLLALFDLLFQGVAVILGFLTGFELLGAWHTCPGTNILIRILD